MEIVLITTGIRNIIRVWDFEETKASMTPEQLQNFQVLVVLQVLIAYLNLHYLLIFLKKNCYQKIYGPIYGITIIVSVFAGLNGRENLQFSTMFLISLFLAVLFSLNIVMSQNVCLEFFGHMRVKVEE